MQEVDIAMKSLLSLHVRLSLVVTVLWIAGISAFAQDAPPDLRGLFGPGHGVRGTVTAVSGSVITVKTDQGDAYKIETGPNTHFRKERQESRISDIHSGDMVIAAGDQDEKAKTVGAIFVIVLDKAQFEKAKADFGKTWTAGSVQSIQDLEITIKRPDNVTQVVIVDENTSFRKHRDSITLADIKTGDNISARGSLQNGKFLATVLNVAEPGQRRGPGMGPEGGFGPGGDPNHAPPAAPPQNP